MLSWVMLQLLRGSCMSEARNQGEPRNQDEILCPDLLGHLEIKCFNRGALQAVLKSGSGTLPETVDAYHHRDPT